MASKEYPGQLEDYARIRAEREKAEKDGADMATVAALNIAEQLSGLAYIADGIRYSTRRAKS
jgi:hypothetical protein